MVPWSGESKMSEDKEKGSPNIFALLQQASKTKKPPDTNRTKLLREMGVQEFFKEGNVTIDMKTCRGLECNLCVEVCPTSALYWKVGEIALIKDLCVYCTACVYSCPVDNCIQLQRKRLNGRIEEVGTQREVLQLLRDISSSKRCERVKSIYPTVEEYLKRFST